MIGMIAIILIAWILGAILTYAVIGYVAPHEVEDDEVIAMSLCLMLWPFLLVFGMGYVIVKLLSMFGDWLRGFLVGLFGKQGE